MRRHREFGVVAPYCRAAPCLLLALLFCVLPFQPLQAVAASGYLPGSGTQTLQVDSQDALAHFPDTIDFSLQAHGLAGTRAELNYSLTGEAVTSSVGATVSHSSGELKLSASVDLASNYIPPGARVTYYWTVTDADGSIVNSQGRTFTLLDQRHPWKTLADVSNRVSVHWYEGDSAFGSDLRDTASGALDRLQHDIGAGLQSRADIWIYPTQDDLVGALPKNIPEWVGGKAFPDLALVLGSIADDSSADMEMKRLVPHELSHLVLYQATRNPYNSPPTWLDEGIAVHNQEVQDPEEAAALSSASHESRLLPLKALSGSFGADEDTALLSYAESRSVVDFIVSDSRYGPKKLGQTIAAFRDGVTYDEALRKGLGVSLDELDREWRATLPANPSDPSLADLLLLIGAGVFVAIFLLGALVLIVVLVQRRRKRTTLSGQEQPD